MKDERGTARRRIYDLIRRYPGLHIRGVEAQLGFSGPLALYHLRRLEAAGYVESREAGGYVRFYPTAKRTLVRLTDADKKLLGYVREQVPLGIILHLLDEGPSSHKDLVPKLGVAPSTLSYHLGKLTADAVVRHREDRRYELANADRVEALFLAYNPTPDLLGRFADLWGSLYGR